jgi:hypothetical protein
LKKKYSEKQCKLPLASEIYSKDIVIENDPDYYNNYDNSYDYNYYGDDYYLRGRNDYYKNNKLTYNNRNNLNYDGNIKKSDNFSTVTPISSNDDWKKKNIDKDQKFNKEISDFSKEVKEIKEKDTQEIIEIKNTASEKNENRGSKEYSDDSDVCKSIGVSASPSKGNKDDLLQNIPGLSKSLRSVSEDNLANQLVNEIVGNTNLNDDGCNLYHAYSNNLACESANEIFTPVAKDSSQQLRCKSVEIQQVKKIKNKNNLFKTKEFSRFENLLDLGKEVKEEIEIPSKLSIFISNFLSSFTKHKYFNFTDPNEFLRLKLDENVDTLKKKILSIPFITILDDTQDDSDILDYFMKQDDFVKKEKTNLDQIKKESISSKITANNK